LEWAANACRVGGGILCLIGFLATCLLFPSKESWVAPVALVCVVVLWVFVFFWFVVISALILLTVEGGRNLRVIRQKVEEGTSADASGTPS
jgi:hypothetical protein